MQLLNCLVQFLLTDVVFVSWHRSCLWKQRNGRSSSEIAETKRNFIVSQSAFRSVFIRSCSDGKLKFVSRQVKYWIGTYVKGHRTSEFNLLSIIYLTAVCAGWIGRRNSLTGNTCIEKKHLNITRDKNLSLLRNVLCASWVCLKPFEQMLQEADETDVSWCSVVLDSTDAE